MLAPPRLLGYLLDGPFLEERVGERRDRGVVEHEGRLQGAADPLGEGDSESNQLT
ncbi:hypothetical protein SAURM35S_00027 [Streptomyces aurantiogriseus]